MCGGTEELDVARYLRPDAAGVALGWQGCHDAASERGDAPVSDGVPQRGLSVCLLLNGGPNTLNAIHAAMRRGSAVLVVHGTGRVADLVADCLRLHEGEDDDDDDGDGGDAPPATPVAARHDGRHDRARRQLLRRVLHTRRLLIVLERLHCAALAGPGFAWPPPVPDAPHKDRSGSGRR